MLGFFMYVLGAACCQQIHTSQIQRSVLSVHKGCKIGHSLKSNLDTRDKKHQNAKLERSFFNESQECCIGKNATNANEEGES